MLFISDRKLCDRFSLGPLHSRYGFCCSCQRCGPWATCFLFLVTFMLVFQPHEYSLTLLIFLLNILFLLQFSVNLQFLKISYVYKIFLQITINSYLQQWDRDEEKFLKYYLYIKNSSFTCNCKSISTGTRRKRCRDSLQRIELFSPTCNLFTEFQEQHIKD